MKEILANSPCFENMSKALEISTMNDEISALIQVIITNNELDYDIRKMLEYLIEINLEYRNYYTDSWHCNKEQLVVLDNYITKIKNELGPISGFTKPAQSKVGSMLNLLRTKNRQVTRLFYVLEHEENVDISHQKIVFTLMNNLLFYSALVVDKRCNIEVRYV